MDDRVAMQINERSEPARALAWAQIAGLVTVHTDGSWSLTDLGRRGVERIANVVPLLDPAIVLAPSPAHTRAVATRAASNAALRDPRSY